MTKVILMTDSFYLSANAELMRGPNQTWLVRGEDRELWPLLPPLGQSCSRTSTSTLHSPPNGYLRLDIMDCSSSTYHFLQM